MELPGVAETFGDELNLIGRAAAALAHPARRPIERALMDQPMDLESAVLAAWRRTATELAGVRRILDAYADAPDLGADGTDAPTAHRKDWALMAAMAGRASPTDRAAADVGRSSRSGPAPPTARSRSDGTGPTTPRRPRCSTGSRHTSPR